MKKLLNGILSLVIFGISIAVLSIGNTIAIAGSDTGGRKPYDACKLLISEDAGMTYAIMNTDGTNRHTIDIKLPTGQVFAENPLYGKLSPDATKIFFATYDNDKQQYFVYSANIDGTNLNLIDHGDTSVVHVIDVK
jgi:hypothetical protein